MCNNKTTIIDNRLERRDNLDSLLYGQIKAVARITYMGFSSEYSDGIWFIISDKDKLTFSDNNAKQTEYFFDYF